MDINWGYFWKCALVRAIKTFCQTALAVIGTELIGINEVAWVSVLSVSALSFVLSILTSVATGLPEVEEITEYDGE